MSRRSTGDPPGSTLGPQGPTRGPPGPTSGPQGIHKDPQGWHMNTYGIHKVPQEFHKDHKGTTWNHKGSQGSTRDPQGAIRVSQGSTRDIRTRGLGEARKWIPPFSHGLPQWRKKMESPKMGIHLPFPAIFSRAMGSSGRLEKEGMRQNASWWSPEHLQYFIGNLRDPRDPTSNSA